MTKKIDLSYIAYLSLAVFLSCFFHEFAHWITGELLGNKMSMSMNTVSPISGTYKHAWHANIITISGPLFTLAQAIVFYFILNKNKNLNLYPFLFFPFVYRFFAGLANMFEANDEGRFGLSFGLGLYTLSIFISSFLFFLILKFSRDNKIGLKFNLINFLLCSIFLLLVVFVDQYFKIKIIG